jgi:hypothetical protein
LIEMAQRADSLRVQAAEFRRLAKTFATPELRDRLEKLAQQCERVADDIERAVDRPKAC